MFISRVTRILCFNFRKGKTQSDMFSHKDLLMFCIFRFKMYIRSTERMRWLACAFVVRIFSKQVFTCRGPTFIASHTFSQPRHDKICLRGFRPGQTQTGLYSDRRWLEALNFGFRKKMDCTLCVTKTKTLISCAITFLRICKK